MIFLVVKQTHYLLAKIDAIIKNIKTNSLSPGENRRDYQKYQDESKTNSLSPGENRRDYQEYQDESDDESHQNKDGVLARGVEGVGNDLQRADVGAVAGNVAVAGEPLHGAVPVHSVGIYIYIYIFF